MYKFTGKERDEESDYDCFGAKYYDFPAVVGVPKSLLSSLERTVSTLPQTFWSPTTKA